MLPLGSEAALAALVRSREGLLAPVLAATAGNVLGACTTYWLGRRAARTLAHRRKPTKREARVSRLLRRYGAPAMLLSPVPVIGDALVALAGATGLPPLAFLLWTTLGKGLRYLVVAWAASSL